MIDNQNYIVVNVAVLGLGSTADNAGELFVAAMAELLKHDCGVMRLSHTYTVSEPYLNCVAVVECAEDYDQLVAITKEIELSLGRTPELKAQGIVPIDIDIVKFNGEVKRSRDFNAPYFTQGYNEIMQS